MTDVEKKVCFHMIQVITRIKYALAEPGEKDFPSILEATAASIGTAAGIAELLKFAKSVYKQFYGSCKSNTGSTELEDIDQEFSDSCEITKTVSKNELKNLIKLLEIKQKHGSEDDSGFQIDEYRSQIHTEIAAAMFRAVSSVTSSTVLPFHVLEFLNFSDTEIYRAAPADHYIDLEWTQEEQQQHDIQMQLSFYSKGVPVVYTTLPMLKLTCESF